MTFELQSRIAKAVRDAHRKGVKANLVVLGRAEEHLLEGEDPTQLHFELCNYLIDNNSKSRCDAYGQASLNYIQPKTRKEMTQREAVTEMIGERFADIVYDEDDPVPALDKKSILTFGFESSSFKSRHDGRVEDYTLTKNKHLHLQRLKNGQFKLYNGSTSTTLYEGIISTIPQLRQLVKQYSN